MSVTMQDIAKAAGVSRATVSIVANGKQEERKIPQKTCEKVYEAMNRLGYQPNVNAKRLKAASESIPIIALFWPQDYRMYFMARTIQGIQNEIQQTGYKCELLVQTYAYNNLDTYTHSILNGNYSGVMIAGLSDRDQRNLESMNTRIPIVLLNRHSQKYSTVGIDNYLFAEYCVQLFCQKGYQEIGILRSVSPYFGSGLRVKHFLKEAEQQGLTAQTYSFEVPDEMEGGAICAEKFLQMEKRLKALYCESDSCALGFISTCIQAGIRIPEELEVIACGYLPRSFSQYTTPSLTILEMPAETIAARALNIIKSTLENNYSSPTHSILQSTLLLRQSFQL